MGAGSFLALVARHSLLPVRRSQVHNIALIDHFQKLHSTTSQPAGALQLLSSFHLDLAERLQQLQLHGSGNAHLNWLLDALACTLSTHSSLQLALTAAASTSSAASLVAKHRTDEVLCMLDVCNSLKQVADDMDRHFGCLQQALQSVGQALINLDHQKPLSSGSRIRAAARRLSVCLMKDDRPDHTNILCITSGNNQYRPLAEARASLLLAAKRELHSADVAADTDPAATLLSQAIDGTMLTSLLVLASAVSSFNAPPSPRKSNSGTITGACKMIVKYLQGAAKTSSVSAHAAWAAPLRQLHRDLRQEEMSAAAAGGAFFQEVQGLHSAAANLQATITNPAIHGIQQLAVVKQSVDSLRKRLQEAQGCITMFRTYMASSFQALLALRLALLHTSTA